MNVRSALFTVNMHGDTHIENVTEQVQGMLTQTGLQAGILTIFVKHTTAAVMIIEDEPGIRTDTKTLFDRLIPRDSNWQHNVRNLGEDNGHSHLRGHLQGPSITIPFTNGTLSLGTWQQVVIVDFDTRARIREILVQILGE